LMAVHGQHHLFLQQTERQGHQQERRTGAAASAALLMLSMGQVPLPGAARYGCPWPSSQCWALRSPPSNTHKHTVRRRHRNQTRHRQHAHWHQQQHQHGCFRHPPLLPHASRLSAPDAEPQSRWQQPSP
jgi:hypothetical protein